MKIAGYETNLTEGQWELIAPMLPVARKLGRKRTSLRRILEALLYIAKAGCQWRLWPVAFPPWQTVYAVFRQWIAEGVWQHFNARLRAWVRAKAGKRCRPTAAILDSQSVKSSPHGGEAGDDAGKKIKATLAVHTNGLGSSFQASMNFLMANCRSATLTNDLRRIAFCVRSPNHRSTWLSQLELGGTKCNRKRA